MRWRRLAVCVHPRTWNVVRQTVPPHWSHSTGEEWKKFQAEDRVVGNWGVPLSALACVVGGGLVYWNWKENGNKEVSEDEYFFHVGESVYTRQHNYELQTEDGRLLTLGLAFLPTLLSRKYCARLVNDVVDTTRPPLVRDANGRILNRLVVMLNANTSSELVALRRRMYEVGLVIDMAVLDKPPPNLKTVDELTGWWSRAAWLKSLVLSCGTRQGAAILVLDTSVDTLRAFEDYAQGSGWQRLPPTDRLALNPSAHSEFVL